MEYLSAWHNKAVRYTYIKQSNAKNLASLLHFFNHFGVLSNTNENHCHYNQKHASMRTALFIYSSLIIQQGDF